MSRELDPGFFERADAHISLANEQLRQVEGSGKVSASMLFAAARFNAWLAASESESGEQMAENRDETVAFFCEQYRLMLEDNLDDYIRGFERYFGR